MRNWRSCFILPRGWACGSVWDVLTNSTGFDCELDGNRLDQPMTAKFAAYTHTLTNSRMMQLALRVEF